MSLGLLTPRIYEAQTYGAGELAAGRAIRVIGVIPIGTNIELHAVDLLSERRIRGSSMD